MLIIGRTGAGNHVVEMTERELGTLGKLIEDVEQAASDLRGVLAFPSPLEPPVARKPKPKRKPSGMGAGNRTDRTHGPDGGKGAKVSRIPTIMAILVEAGEPTSVTEIAKQFEERTGLAGQAKDVGICLASAKKRFKRVGQGMYYLADGAYLEVPADMPEPDRMLVEAKPNGLNDDAKARRLELIRELMNK